MAAVEVYRGVNVSLGSGGMFLAEVEGRSLQATTLVGVRKKIEAELKRTEVRADAVSARIPCVVLETRYQSGKYKGSNEWGKSWTEPTLTEGIFAGLDPNNGQVRLEIAGTVRNYDRGVQLLRADDPAVDLLRKAGARWVEAQHEEQETEDAFQTLKKTSGIGTSVGQASKKVDRQRLVAAKEVELLAYLKGEA